MNQPEPAIERLDNVNWFSNVTRPVDISLSLTIEPVPNWETATQLRDDIDSENAFLEAKGRLTVALSAKHRDSYRQWNNYVRPAREMLENQIIPDVSARVSSAVNADFVLDSVRWDLIHYVMEYVYSDLVPPTFYTLLFDIYAAGHFPCNWDERWPDGRLWVL